MLEVIEIEEAAVADLRYLNASRRGGTEVCHLAIQRARVRGLPESLDAIIATSDLQGIVHDPRTRESTLLGVAVAELLEELAFDAVLPPAQRTGVIMAGDMYSVPAANERGGFGSVASVWEAFAGPFAWVIGVAGNHDDVNDVRRDERMICGHVHWPEPLARHERGQILNVDTRVIVLTRAAR